MYSLSLCTISSAYQNHSIIEEYSFKSISVENIPNDNNTWYKNWTPIDGLIE